MKATHTQALRAFQRRVAAVLAFRRAVQACVLWFCLWGVVVLAARFAGVPRGDWLFAGVLGCVPLIAAAVVREHLHRPPFSRLRAAYDRARACGGVVMAGEVADMSAWQARLPPPAVPELRWHSGRILLLFGASALFLAVALLLPERYAHFRRPRPLAIGQIVQELQAEVLALQEEKIVEEKKASDLQRQLEQLERNATGLDPGKTWEALDHIKESNADAAKRAAEEALNKLTELAQAETLASALALAAEMGLSEDTATRAAQELAAMIRAAKLEEGVLKGTIPPEVLSNLDKFSEQDLEALLRSLSFNRNSLSNAVARLAKLKLIDPALLAQCNRAGQCKPCDGLAAYLAACTNASESVCAATVSYCRGGINRGRGDAPMTWTDGTSEEGAKFKEEALPPATRLEDAQLVGVSRAAPEVSGDEVATGSGALANAAGSGGSAHAQAVLPRHRQAVQRFFERDQK